MWNVYIVSPFGNTCKCAMHYRISWVCRRPQSLPCATYGKLKYAVCPQKAHGEKKNLRQSLLCRRLKNGPTAKPFVCRRRPTAKDPRTAMETSSVSPPHAVRSCTLCRRLSAGLRHKTEFAVGPGGQPTANLFLPCALVLAHGKKIFFIFCCPYFLHYTHSTL